MQSLSRLKFYLQLNDDGPAVFAVAMIYLSDKTRNNKRKMKWKNRQKKEKHIRLEQVMKHVMVDSFDFVSRDY